jgi:hypothetical protein
MHDPFQTHPLMAAYYGLPGAAGIGPASFQSAASNPMAGVNPIAAAFGSQTGQQPYMGSPGLSGLAAGLQNPFVTGLVNPLVAAALQNQLNPGLAMAQHSLAQHILAQQVLAQLLATQANSPYQQYQQQPFGQAGLPFGQQIGQAGLPFGQQIGQAGLPFGQQIGQTASPFGQIGYPLAPQSWVGQPSGLGSQPFAAQMQPLLSQLAGRQAGMSPWGL